MKKEVRIWVLLALEVRPILMLLKRIRVVILLIHCRGSEKF